jgi:signal transduction histidine kinase
VSDTPRPASRPATTPRIAAAAILLAAGLLVVGWLDYRATRQDLLTLLVEQAASLRQAVAAAARSADAATAQAQSSLGARLLDNARLLDRLDRQRGLTQAALDEIARAHRLFRVTVFSASGAREMSAGLGGPPPGAGRGFGPGPGGGAGGGGGFGNTLAERLLSGGEAEAVSEVHGSRWGRGWRMSAGVHRSKGGAIVLNVDASDIADLQQQASIDHVLDEIAAGTNEIAYVILADGDARTAHGRLAQAALAGPGPDAQAAPPLAAGQLPPGLSAYELDVEGVPVLEFAGSMATGDADAPVLRLGLSLEGLRSAERRSLTRLVVSLAAALGLGVLAMAFVGLRREHGVLQEQHALAQESLRRRDRLAAMGELASTVAHEVRNPLNAIGMSAQRLRREFLDAPGPLKDADRDERRELLDVLSSETRRIDRIVQQFLEFARPPRLAPRAVDLAALLGERAAAVAALASTRGVGVKADVGDAGTAHVDADQFNQAIDNLLRNAVEASPSGATVWLRASRDGAGHHVVVEDQGPGIAPEHLAKVFDLYFTTKADGTGVGLAVTHQIVEAHGGSIEVDTEVGRGTRMIVRLPQKRGDG